MTPAARYAAAIEVLDAVLGGVAAEAALSRWARGARYAGSKDRADVRDIVFDGLRQRRSRGFVGGADSGRGIVLGGLRLNRIDPETLFGQGGYSAPPLTADEQLPRDLQTAPPEIRCDCPGWLWPLFAERPEAQSSLEVLRNRAPIGIRVNAGKSKRADVLDRLCAEGLDARPSPLSPHAIMVSKARGLDRHELYQNGIIEVQDPGAQRLVDLLPLVPGQRIVDYCAGGGGKALGIAARHDTPVLAYDAAPQRMRDLPKRATRAGAQVEISNTPPSGSFDGVVLDVPCSGSGAWRRQPDAKWRLTPDRLHALRETQAGLLRHGLSLCAPGGWCAYMTCSILQSENEDIVDALLNDDATAHLEYSERISLSNENDGFYFALFRTAV